MAPTALVTTAGSASANAYVSVAGADAYTENLPLAAVRLVWTAATSDDKIRAILTATRLIDRTFEFAGYRVSTTQALAWPRVFSLPTSYGYGTGTGWYAPYYIDPLTIPDQVKDATAEYARQLLESDRTADVSVSAATIKKLKADVIEIEYRDDAAMVGKPVPDAVALLLAGLGWLTSGSLMSVPLMRV